jgi:hypothetical protein
MQLNLNHSSFGGVQTRKPVSTTAVPSSVLFP